jgi:hypothetical protein
MYVRSLHAKIRYLTDTKLTLDKYSIALQLQHDKHKEKLQ